MKRITLSIAMAALIAAPAYSASTTIAFESDAGETSQVTLHDDGTVTTAAGESVYTYDEDAARLCIDVDEYSECYTFSDPGTDVGHSSPYTFSIGGGGTATITAITE